ncbi:hypothetical protein CLOM621_06293 [Clostridium sp. M62/1]|nr:hypothetical protein CLOM621_06293 [Clostridium sp. M62/1]
MTPAEPCSKTEKGSGFGRYLKTGGETASKKRPDARGKMRASGLFCSVFI